MFGQTIDCPSCQGQIKIPNPISQPQQRIRPPQRPSPLQRPAPDPRAQQITPAPPPQHKTCPFCGEEILLSAIKCKHCGEFLDERPKQTPFAAPIMVTAPKSRSAAVLLAILLGGLGLHKFYLNSPGWGVFYLLFCWTFIPSIIGFLEGLGYLFMSEQNFQNKYGGIIQQVSTSLNQSAQITKDKPALNLFTRKFIGFQLTGSIFIIFGLGGLFSYFGGMKHDSILGLWIIFLVFGFIFFFRGRITCPISGFQLVGSFFITFGLFSLFVMLVDGQFNSILDAIPGITVSAISIVIGLILFFLGLRRLRSTLSDAG
ncbi:MAG: NINE protein [Verrucomicrobia bacterium]|nr:NINE protein [Verrucomicrobiota bacterium]MBU4290535.1 NINE protein [Verrucomicrobiota bacterium]MBU4428495.1 NINE protein [Verrucomicrobiota bacterium]MBU4497592.1 NINE protein [Verrucomicrobiota bacterium]